MARPTLSLSVRLIAAIAGLVAVAVIGFGLFNLRDIQAVHDRHLADQKRLLETQLGAQLGKVGAATIQTLAASCRTFIENSDDTNLRAYVRDVARKDKMIVFAYVLDADERLIAHTDEAKSPRDGHAEFGDPSWDRVKAAWADQPPLESLARGPIHVDAEQALFALPILPGGALVKTALLGGGFLIAGVVLAVLYGLHISRPIRALAERADRIAGGDLSSRVEVTSHDEIGTLGKSFNHMADRLQMLLAEAAAKASLEKELELARAVQSSLVPGGDLVRLDAALLAGHFQPASQCGGDWWTWRALDGGAALVVIGDATGHGASAAIITAAAKAACDVAQIRSADDLPELVATMNRAVYQSSRGSMFMTCFASVINPTTRDLTFVNAGHTFPYVARSSNGNVQLEPLAQSGSPLGYDAQLKCRSRTVQLLAGDLVVWYTDGVIDCRNAKGETFTDKRFRKAIKEAARHEDPIAARTALVDSAERFTQGHPLPDDITLVVGRLT